MPAERRASGSRMGNGGSAVDGVPDGVPDGAQLMRETGFSAAVIARLLERFEFLDKDASGRLRPEDFEAIGELSMNPIGDRIIGAFFPGGQETLDFPAFVRTLAHFRPTDTKRRRGETPQEELASSGAAKLRFAFQLYDQDGDGVISRKELLQVLRAMMGMHVTEEQLRCIGNRAFQEADGDGDGAISLDEFKKSLEKVNIEQKMSVRFLK